MAHSQQFWIFFFRERVSKDVVMLQPGHRLDHSTTHKKTPKNPKQTKKNKKQKPTNKKPTKKQQQTKTNPKIHIQANKQTKRNRKRQTQTKQKKKDRKLDKLHQTASKFGPITEQQEFHFKVK